MADTSDKIAIVRLGSAAGKMKYALLDLSDVQYLKKKYTFVARLDLDKNGTGAWISAWMYEDGLSELAGCYLHDFVWKMHCGSVPDGYRIVHRNGIILDNRWSNLDLLPVSQVTYPNRVCVEIDNEDTEETLYWKTLASAAVINPVKEYMQYSVSPCGAAYNTDGEIIQSEENLFYECHNPPCLAMESQPSEFKVCSRCRRTRYCSRRCLHLDWRNHRNFCKSLSLRDPVVLCDVLDTYTEYLDR